MGQNLFKFKSVPILSAKSEKAKLCHQKLQATVPEPKQKKILKVSKIKAGNLRHFYNKWKNIIQDPFRINRVY